MEQNGSSTVHEATAPNSTEATVSKQFTKHVSDTHSHDDKTHKKIPEKTMQYKEISTEYEYTR